MRIAFGCDHAGFPLKDALVDALQADGHDLLDLGTFSEEPVDYPDFARAVANAVQKKFVDLGVLVCGSGIGASIAANKFRGIRAARSRRAAWGRHGASGRRGARGRAR